MRTIKERTENPSAQQKRAETIAKEHVSEEMKIAAQAVKRARLVQNRLFQQESSSVYRKIF